MSHVETQGGARPLQLLIGFAYDGAAYHGLVPQPHHATAGAAILARLQAAFGPAVPWALSWAARLDAGVHARFNLMSCRWPCTAHSAALSLMGSCAATLPIVILTASDGRAGGAPSGPWRTLAGPDAPDRSGRTTDDPGLRGLAVCALPQRTLARALPVAKHYQYMISDGWADVTAALWPTANAWSVAPRLRFAPMAAAAQVFEGCHDFTAFAAAPKRRPNSARGLPKTILRLQVTRIGSTTTGTQWRIDCHATGLLRRQMRHMVFAIVAAGAGLVAPSALAQRLRHAAPPPQPFGHAPAHGLTLVDLHCSGASTAAVDGLRRAVVDAYVAPPAPPGSR
jgi:tRNA U38,U39,U40 pseudouridine synthase TruA